MANTQAVADPATQHYVLEVRLDDGETLHAAMGDDLESARTQLAAIHTRFGSEAFVLLGDDTVVRTGDIRHIQLHEREPSGRGLLGTLKARVGGDNVSTHDSEQVTETRRTGGGARRPQSGGVLDEAFDVCVFDRTTGRTRLISKSTSGQTGDGDSFYPSISADARFVAFSSRSDNFSGADDNNYLNAFARGPLR
jgi:hypothetical protein